MYIQEIIEIMNKKTKIYDILEFCPYEVLSTMKIFDYKKGDIIFAQDEVYKRVCIIIDGKVDINIISENGKKYSQAIYQMGNLLGELEIFELFPFACNIEAITNVRLISIERDVFLKWLELDRNFNLYLIKLFSHSYYHLSKKAANDALYTLYNRICNFLIKNAEVSGVQKSNTYELIIEKTLLSQQFAVTQRSINRVLQELKEKSILNYDNSKIIIRDFEKLIFEEKTSRFL